MKKYAFSSREIMDLNTCNEQSFKNKIRKQKCRKHKTLEGCMTFSLIRRVNKIFVMNKEKLPHAARCTKEIFTNIRFKLSIQYVVCV